MEEFEDFGMLLFNEELSDVKILVSDDDYGEHVFHAHKYVLSKKSDVFEAMFRCDMLESKSNFVKIEDVPIRAMASLLRYIYTDLVLYVADSKYLDLMKAADKYQILDLKAVCEYKILEDELTVENAFEVLAAADQSNTFILKEITAVFCEVFEQMINLVSHKNNIVHEDK